MKLSVIIPVFNERDTLTNLIEKVRAVEIEKEIVLVDDYSTDGTRDLYPQIQHLVDKIILHEKNQGKGAAIRTGIKHVTGDVTVIQDADLEYDPQEYHILLQPILDDKADVVYGSRFLTGKAHRVLYFWHSVGNKFLTLLSNMFTNLTLTDMETCYKMVRTDILKKIEIEQNRFGMEPEITGKLAGMDLRFFEVGISYNGRSYDEGKKIGWKDGFQALWCIVKYRRSKYRVRDYGKETLEQLENFDDYADYMFQKINPHLGTRVMELGTGIGNNVKHLVAVPNRQVILTEFREDYVETLREKWGSNPNVAVHQWDATAGIPDVLQSAPPDSIVCLNVLEHIEQDRKALANCYELLPPGGRMVVLVPAFQALYSKIDKNLDHFRRYSREELQSKFREAGFRIKGSFFFNTVGFFGWFVAGRILGASQVQSNHVWISKMLLPVSRLLDKFNLPFGLSVVCIGEKPLDAAPAPSKPQVETVTISAEKPATPVAPEPTEIP